MTRYCLTRESETVCQRYVLKKKQRKNKVTLFAAEQDGAEQYKKRRPEENPLHQMQAGVLYGPAGKKSRHAGLSCSEAPCLPSKNNTCVQTAERNVSLSTGLFLYCVPQSANTSAFVTRPVGTNKASSMGPLAQWQAGNLDMTDFPALRRLIYRARKNTCLQTAERNVSLSMGLFLYCVPQSANTSAFVHFRAL
ncbi:hypothetical protein NDU88_002487 [Pleurodeles waltl]|uniref:Uncharacterized protein n=1 Tax=Pleurodeles waltl TaxID=8319 RepID=A0AAV7M4B5_PLEWA|nr:hypothetical protein NDU88_002487 [Pleurodeles waltl]